MMGGSKVSLTITEEGGERILHIFHPGDAFNGLLMGVAHDVPIWAEALDQIVVGIVDEAERPR